ncbi:hypothetical protein JKF63_02830 [Porcisia hertigi]|uniref:Ku domain-containing protein n=1 Tax=Porcisia hertigi TaxID=2761500 RepID=A0A836L506_9TRYP|nr:hypothetical protein JKF63_02830 [Porcisia hertigi]
MFKDATVLVLDVTLHRADALERACDLCTQIVTDKMVCAPSDEVAVILAGTEKSHSAPYCHSEHVRYSHITVATELGPATKQTLVPIAATRAGVTVPPGGVTAAQELTTQAFDFIDALHVAVAMLQARTSHKKYNRCICLITDARHEVRHKEELLSLIDALQRDQVTVVVIGVDFQVLSECVNSQEEHGRVVGGDAVAWAELCTKTQNEKVLEALCTELGPPSTLASLAEALASFSSLHRRKIHQQPIFRVALRIGDVRLATQLFTLTQEERLPALRRSTQDGADVVQSVEYVVSGGSDEQPLTFSKEERVEAFLLGVDCVLCSEADRDAMRIKGPRSLEAIGFVRETEVEPYILMGGTRVLLPLAADHAGQRGFNALVDAMASNKKAMLVRLVRTTDAAPSLCVCFARTAEATTEQRRLVLAPLPFAEDTRALCFSEYLELQFSEAEEQLMSDLIDGLSVSSSVLAPQDTFNPLLQQYYATLKAKLSTVDVWTGEDKAKAASSEAAMPQLLPMLRGTSTDFFAEGGEVYEAMSAHRSTLESCASAFPYEDDADAPLTNGNGAGWKGKPWYQNLTTPSLLLNTQAGAPSSTAQGSGGSPSTVAAAILDGGRGEDVDSASAGSCAALEVISISTAPHNIINDGAPLEISTVDPVGDFSAIVYSPAATEAQVNKAKDDLSYLIWEILRKSMKDSLYRKCVLCMIALRQLCVTQGDAAYYSDFLLKLEVVAQECGRYADFWVPYVVEQRDSVKVWPITAHECKSSLLPDDVAAEAFLKEDRLHTGITVDNVAGDDDDWLADIQ